jgi:predicted XRE-type DNA-binding protein
MTAKNVYSEFGLENDVATVEAWRSDLARIVRAYFTRSQLSQTAFAKKLGIKQSVVSRIINSRLSGLSIEFLLRLCVKLETRGHAAWGPSADEAFATDEAPIPVGTKTIVLAPAYSGEWEPLDIPVEITNKTASKSGSSRSN